MVASTAPLSRSTAMESAVCLDIGVLKAIRSANRSGVELRPVTAARLLVQSEPLGAGKPALEPRQLVTGAAVGHPSVMNGSRSRHFQADCWDFQDMPRPQSSLFARNCHNGARIIARRGAIPAQGYQTWWRSGRDSNSRTELPRLRHFQCGLPKPPNFESCVALNLNWT